MADQPEEGVVGSGSQPKMVTMTLNNRDIEVPESAVEILRQEEHNLKSGYDKKLADERASITAEAESHANLLDEDLNWYSSHDESEWGSYIPKVKGGTGYQGSGNPKSQTAAPAKSTPTQTDNSSNAFGLKQELEILKAQNKKLQNDVLSVMDNDLKRVEDGVRTVRDAAIKKYPYANTASVNDALMSVYRNNNGVHATAAVIEKIVKEKHDHVAKIRGVTTTSTTAPTPKSTLPNISGNAPGGKTPTLPDLDDVDGWEKEGKTFFAQS